MNRIHKNITFSEFVQINKRVEYYKKNFSGYDCHLIFEQLLTQVYKVNGEQISIIPKSMENYVSVQVVCLRFLDSYRFLRSGLDKLVRSKNSFSIMDSNNIEDELF